MADVIFKDAEEARDSITKRELKEIRHLYTEWAKDIKREYNSYKLSGGTNIQKMRDLAKMYYNMRNASKQVGYEINNRIIAGVTDISNITVAVNNRWLKSLGIDANTFNAKYSYASNVAVRNIITGNLYEDKMPLSSRIWNITEYQLKDIYTIISYGIAQNKSVYEISKMLEKYVNPRARSPFRVVYQDGKPYIIHNVKSDYNAIRLARTMIQHSYQNTLVTITRNNPLVKGYIWHASGGHVCELCQDRDGTFYTADDIPMDHPNGQCTIEVVLR